MLPFIIISAQWKRTNSYKEKENISCVDLELESNIIEYVQGLFVLKSLNCADRNYNKINHTIENIEKIQRQNSTKSIFPLIILNISIEIIFLFLIILVYLANLSLELPFLIALLLILNKISESLSNFLAINPITDTIQIALKDIQNILNIKSLKLNLPTKKPTNFEIRFENVYFSYEKNTKNILNNISFSIKPNSLTTIIGSSGSGKTTIMRLLARYADPTKGDIFIGGINIKNIKEEDLNSLISIVFQDVYLLNDTIYNNIKLGKNNATKEEIIYASKMALCHDFVLKLTNQYDTKVGDLGKKLSGGEKQRISIARAILKNAPIIILDEPTSSLDIFNEILVQNAINSLIKNKTIIEITHKLSNISNVDNTIIMDKGKIII